MKDRIHDIMTHMGLSQQDFASRLKMAPASISSIFSGRTNPTINHVMAIHKAFPQVNEKWLLYGEGEMMEGEHPVSSPTVEVASSDEDEELAVMGDFFGQSSAASSTVPSASASNVAPETSQPTSRSQRRVASSVREEVKTASAPVQNDNFENVKIVDKKFRRVKEIRVFYDDNTYETFIPAVKL